MTKAFVSFFLSVIAVVVVKCTYMLPTFIIWISIYERTIQFITDSLRLLRFHSIWFLLRFHIIFSFDDVINDDANNVAWNAKKKLVVNYDDQYSGQKKENGKFTYASQIIHTYIHNWPLQPFSQNYWPSFSHHLFCVC